MLVVDTPQAWILFGVSLAAWMLAETVIFRNGRSVDADGVDHDKGSIWSVLGSAMLALVLAAIIAVAVPAARIDGGWVLFGAGIALVWLGNGLRLWAVRVLGTFFQPQVTIQNAHRVITAGPYSVLRHPSYTGALIVQAGLGLSTGNILSTAVLVVVPTLGYVHRIRVEEAALAEALGTEYTDYQKGSSRLVPGVW